MEGVPGALHECNGHVIDWFTVVIAEQNCRFIAPEVTTYGNAQTTNRKG